MQKRLAMTAFIAAILGGAAFSAFRAPWYVASASDFSVPLRLTELDLEYMLVFLVALLVNVYFFARLIGTAILLLNGGPTSTRVIAWYTPAGAHIQGTFSLIAAVVVNVMTPMHDVLGLPATIARSYGGALLIACNVLAQVAIFLIAHDRTLAKTQTWVDDDGAPVPKRKHRWIRAAPQQRPLVKPPLSSTPAVGGDPFRAAPPTGIEAALVKPKTNVEAPRKDDDAAPGPKLLT
jgi:hypothetical protein